MRSNLKRSHVAVATLAAALLAVAPAAALNSSGSSGAAPANSAAVKLPNVVILCTGGTIAGTGASTTTTVGYTAAKIGCDTLVDGVPELKKVGNVRGEQVYQIASESLLNEHTLEALQAHQRIVEAGRRRRNRRHPRHRTIEETSYFLDLAVKSKKPVVIVGAMRPSTAISADGPINLYNAVSRRRQQGGGRQGRARRSSTTRSTPAREVTKTNTSTADTFRTPDLGMLGYMQDNKPHFYRTRPASIRRTPSLTSPVWIPSRRSTSSMAMPMKIRSLSMPSSRPAPKALFTPVRRRQLGKCWSIR